MIQDIKDQIYTKFIKELTELGPRRGINEQEAAKLIKSFLSQNKVSYKVQQFKTTVPVTIKAELKADGEDIACIGASLKSGKFSKKTEILNSYSAFFKKPAILFNPVSEGVCLQSYKDFPAIAINRDSVVKLLMSKTVSGILEVEKLKYDTENILVGNHIDPINIIFAHYDSIVGSGAVDNAGAVAVLCKIILSNTTLMKNNLFVFIGSEEESISSKYGLYGFQIFDKEYSVLYDKVMKIIVLDGVGIGSPKLTPENIDWVFDSENLDQLSDKVLWLQNDQSLVMKYYHSELDTIDKVKKQYLSEAENLVIKKISEND